MRQALLCLALSLAACSSTTTSVPEPSSDPLTRLMDGNRRFVSGAPSHQQHLEAQRRDAAAGQAPFAIVLTCSDSRVSPEYIFDEGIGDLFVVRIAGNVADAHALGSIEYSAQVLGSKVVMVMGHERCGAVKAAMGGEDAPGNVGSLVRTIAPGIRGAKAETGDALDDAVRQNVRAVVASVRRNSPALAGMERDGKLRIVGGHYDLDTGEVTIVE